MSTSPIRLGLIGTGLAVERLHWPALRQMPDRFRVVAFADQSRTTAEKFAADAGLSMEDAYHADYRDMLGRDDVEAVLVALPIPLLYDAARAALEAGKHVLSEKPPGADLEQGRAFLGLAETFPDRKILVGENFFYRDDLRLARSLLDAGAIGRLQMMSWRFVVELVPRAGRFSSTPWRWTPAYRGGPLLDANVHHVAQIRLLCGDAHELQAHTREANPTMGGPSHLVLNLGFVSGAIGSLVAGHLPFPSPGESNDMRLYGDAGVMALTGGPGVPRRLRVYRPDGTGEEHAIDDADNGYHHEWLNFHDALVHNEPIVGTIIQSFHNLLLVMRALDSAEQGGVVVGLADAPDGLHETGVPLWRPRGAAGLFDELPVRVTSRPIG